MRGLLARTPLRVKLVAAMLGLVLTGLVLVGVTSVLLVHRHLLQGADEQITTLAKTAQGAALDAANADGSQAQRQDLPDAGVPEPLLPTQFVILIFSADGQLAQQRSAPMRAGDPGPKVPADPAWLAAHQWHPGTVRATSGDGDWRVVTAPDPQGQGTIAVAMDLTEVDQTVTQLALIEIAAGGAVVVLLAGVGVAIVRSSMRPLTEIERTAAAIASGDLSRRVAERDGRTEVGRLGQALNTMLTQIEEAFGVQARSEARMRGFIADAGHELRTPLSVIRAFADYYRRNRHDVAGVERMVGHVEVTAVRMARLVDDLLLLARLDAQRPLERRPVDLLVVVGDAVRDARLIAPGRRVAFAFGSDAAFLVEGDETRLRQVMDNLVGNALRHTPAGTPVDVRLTVGSLRGAPAAVVDVADEGPGLTDEQAARVFERFYRADPSRNSGSGGSGLGLSIVAAVVAAHGGEVSVDSSPGGGATFRVAVPLAADAAAQYPFRELPGTPCDPVENRD